MSSVSKTSGGRWRARYRDANNRTRSRTFDRKIDAARFLERLGADLQRGDWIDPQHAFVSFDEIADLWWSTTIKLAPLTRRGYWLLLKNHVRPFFGERAQGSIDWLLVEEFIAEKLTVGLGPKHVRSMVSVMSLVMTTAVKAGLRKDNPAAGHPIRIRRRKLDEGDVLTMEQVHLLPFHTRDPYKPLVWMCVLEGPRPAELCGLRVRHLNFTRRIVHFSETVNEVNHYDDNPISLQRGPTKTAAGDRVLPVGEALCEDLAMMLADRAQRRGTAIDPDEPLFESLHGGEPLRPSALRRNIMRPALRAAGLPETLRTYDLRHTHASLLIAEGADPLALAQRMGHTDPAITLRLYGHLFEGAQQSLTDKLDALRNRTSAPAVVDLSERRQQRARGAGS